MESICPILKVFTFFSLFIYLFPTIVSRSSLLSFQFNTNVSLVYLVLFQQGRSEGGANYTRHNEFLRNLKIDYIIIFLKKKEKKTFTIKIYCVVLNCFIIIIIKKAPHDSFSPGLDFSRAGPVFQYLSRLHLLLSRRLE